MQVLDVQVTAVSAACQQQEARCAQLATMISETAVSTEGKIGARVDKALADVTQLAAAVQQLVVDTELLKQRGAGADHHRVAATMQMLEEQLEQVKAAHAVEKDVRKTEVEGLGAMVLSVQEHLLQLRSSTSSRSSTPVPVPALQDFERRIARLEGGRESADAEISALKAQLQGCSNSVEKMMQQVVVVDARVQKLEGLAGHPAATDATVAKIQAEMHVLSDTLRAGQSEVQQLRMAAVHNAARHEKQLGDVVKNVQQMLVVLRDQMATDRHAIAGAVGKLKAEVKRLSSAVPVVQTAASQSTPSAPTPHLTPPAVPVPSSTLTPVHPIPTAPVTHSLPPEFRLARNAAVSTGFGLLGPVIVGGVSPTPAPAATEMHGSAVVNMVSARIAPVGVQSLPAPAVQVLPGTIAQALIGKEPGKFGGTAEDWSTWRMRWQSYLREVEDLYPTMTGRQKLSLLRHWLDDATAELLDFEMSSRPGLVYEAYWAKLDLSFGAEDKEVLRRRLRTTRLVNRGKLEEKPWREFESKLLRLSRQLGDVSDVELGRLMMDALPPQPWRRKLAEEAEKKTQARRLVVAGVPEAMTPQQLETLIEVETGRRATAVYREPDGYKVKAADDDHRNIIKMVFDRQLLQGGAVLTVAPEVQELTGTEVSHFMLKWLRLEQRISVGSGSQQTEPQRPDRGRLPPRYHRKLDAEEEEGVEEDEEGVEADIQEVRAPRAKQAPAAGKLPKPPTNAAPTPNPTVPSPRDPATAGGKESTLQQQLAEMQRELQQLKQQSASMGTGKGGWNSSGAWQGGGRGQWQSGWSGERGGGKDAEWRRTTDADGKGRGEGRGDAKGGKGDGKGKGGRGGRGDEGAKGGRGDARQQ